MFVVWNPCGLVCFTFFCDASLIELGSLYASRTFCVGTTIEPMIKDFVAVK